MESSILIDSILATGENVSSTCAYHFAANRAFYPNNSPILIHFIFEDLFSSNDVFIFRSFSGRLNIISSELVELFLYSHYLVWII